MHLNTMYAILVFQSIQVVYHFLQILCFVPPEANIVGEITRCREAIETNSWSIVQAVAQSIAAKGYRLMEVSRVLMESAIHNPGKKASIQQGLDKLDKGLQHDLLQLHIINAEIFNQCNIIFAISSFQISK